jgi:hypothetical protein
VHDPLLSFDPEPATVPQATSAPQIVPPLPTGSARQIVRTAQPIQVRREQQPRHRTNARAPRATRTTSLWVFGFGLVVGALITLVLSRTAVESKPPIASPQPAIARQAPAAATPVSVQAPTAPVALGTTSTTIDVTSPTPPLEARRRAAANGFRGSLVVNSQPRGASVFINGELAGRTPLVLSALPAGSRAVRVRLDGYSAWSRAVRVVANQSTTVLADLKPVE